MLARSQANRNRVNELDLLRFLAALAVVFFHYAFRGFAADHLTPFAYSPLLPAAQYGYLGVELFFMISGFVILVTASHGDFQQFVASRMSRLYPAFWVSVTLTFLFITFWGGQLFQVTLKQYFLNLTLLSDFMHVQPIDGVYWSLFVELRFYLLVAVILLLKQIHYAQAWLIAWLIAVITLEFIWPVDNLRYIFIIDYAVYFIAGAVAYLIWQQGFSWLRLNLLLICWFISLYQSSLYALDLDSYYQVDFNILWIALIISFFYILLLLVALRRTAFLGFWRWTLLGGITYPLYLLHQNIGYILFNRGFKQLPNDILFWAVLACVLSLAIAVYMGVERWATPTLRQALLRAFAWLEMRCERLKLNFR